MTSAPCNSDDAKPYRFELRVSLLYFAAFIPSGIHLPYFPLWLEHQRFSPSEISFILALPLFIRVLSAPTVSVIADHSNDRANVFTVIALLSVIAVSAYFLPLGFLGVLFASIVFAAPWTSQTPVSDAIALSGVRRYGVDYAKLRVWGSISFLLSAFATGFLIQRFGAAIIPTLLFLTLILVFAVSLIVPRIGRPRRSSPLSEVDLADARRALRSPSFLVFLIGTGITQGSHAYNYSFSAIYWKSVHVSEGAIGALWATSVLAEVAMFGLFQRFFGHFQPTKLLAIGSLAATLRWASFPFIAPLGLAPVGFFASQSLHAFSFAITFLGLQKMIVRTVPEERVGAAQGLATALLGAALASVTMISGPLYGAAGVHGFYVMGFLAMTGFGLALLSARLEPRATQPQSDASGGKTRLSR